MAKSNNTLLYAGLGLAAFMLLKKKSNNSGSDEVNGIGAKEKFVVGKVIETKYRNSTSAGNPSYYVTLETADGDILYGYTSPNSSLAYGIQNPEYKYKNHAFAYTEGKRGLMFHYAVEI